MAKAKLNTDTIVTTMEGFFVKLPALPKNIKDFIATVIPWVALVFGALGILGSLAGLGIGTFAAPFSFMVKGVNLYGIFALGMVISLVVAVLTLIAGFQLLKKRVLGWKLLFWAEIIAGVGSLITFSLSGLVFAFIWFYILFQIKSYYK